MTLIADIKSLAETILPNYDVNEAYLFGSIAQGDYTESSDIDIRLS